MSLFLALSPALLILLTNPYLDDAEINETFPHAS